MSRACSWLRAASSKGSVRTSHRSSFRATRVGSGTSWRGCPGLLALGRRPASGRGPRVRVRARRAVRRAWRPGRPDLRYGSADSHAAHGRRGRLRRLLAPARARDERDRGHRQARLAGRGEQQHDPAEAPPDGLHRRPAGVRGYGAKRRGQDVLDPMLEPQSPVAEGDGPIVDEVRGIPESDQVLGDAAAATKVEAAGGRGERRHEQHRRATGPTAPPAPVAVYRPLRPSVDDRRGLTSEVRGPGPDQQVEAIRRGVEQGFGIGNEAHCETVQAGLRAAAASLGAARRRQVEQRAMARTAPRPASP
jgi:hypothetical protein